MEKELISKITAVLDSLNDEYDNETYIEKLSKLLELTKELVNTYHPAYFSDKHLSLLEADILKYIPIIRIERTKYRKESIIDDTTKTIKGYFLFNLPSI